MIRRRWRMCLWIMLMVVIFLNAAVFFSIPGSKEKFDLELEGQSGRVMSHLPVFRKRLNINNGSSSLRQAQSGKGNSDPELGFKVGEPHQDSYDHFLKSIFLKNLSFGNVHQLISDFRQNHPQFIGGKSVKGLSHVDLSAAVSADKDEEQASSKKRWTSGVRANYSIQEVDYFTDTFVVKYEQSYFAMGNSTTSYGEYLSRLTSLRKRGVRLRAYINNKGKHSWERFHHNIHQHYLYDPDDPWVSKLLKDMTRKPVADVEQKDGGTQIKLILTMEGDGQALFKPMRFPREQDTLPDHFYFADFERHNAEIAAFHLDKLLGFHRVPPTVGRLMNVSRDIQEFANSKLAKTFFISPAGNLCFHGQCSYYCDSSHPICGHPIMLEGSLAAFLPPMSMAKRKTWRNPWKRSYSKHRKAYWEVYNDLCLKVKSKHPYNEGRRLMDILDMSVFDFLTGNLDRHHYETFREFGNNTFLLHLDNGRAFGKAKYDCVSCLAPVRQCCMIRLSTLAKLVKLYRGPDSLSEVMRWSLSVDLVSPILTESHLDALDRRVSKLLDIIDGCIKKGRSWSDVVIDDGIT